MTVFSAGEEVFHAQGQAERTMKDRAGMLLNQRWVYTEIHKEVQ